VLLTEYLVLALRSAAAGLAAGWLAAPLPTSPGAGLVGTTGPPPVTAPIAALVVAVALAVAVGATFAPAIRAARTSTVSALADAARRPRRRPGLIALSAHLPIPLLLGLRVSARRPRRIVLSAISIAITVTTIVTVLMVHAHDRQLNGSAGLANPQTDRLNAVLLVIMVVLVVLAAVNVIFITWATALDARRSSALARALGATPEQVAAGLSVAQVLPALPGALLGVPAGIGLYAAADHGATMTAPPVWQLVAVVLGTLLVVAGLAAIPARIGARRPVAEILQSETA
jgi:putative ABC transport system permease protein